MPNAQERLARKPVYAARGAVATSQPLAASAGLNVLRAGGNAVDAAIATAAALTVVQPGANDIGSDLFALVWDGSRLHGLNASGRSPAALTVDAARAAARPAGAAFGGAQAEAAAAMPDRGWLPVTVPGTPAGWRDLHERFGAAPFGTLFEDAIAYASEGFPVARRLAAHWNASVTRVHAGLSGPEFDSWARIFTLDGGRAPREGERWRNPDAARTLELIAASKAEEFYHGEIAKAITAHASATGGLITTDDLARHASAWVEPISARYRGYDVWEIPPNGQGIAALIALSILDGVDLPGMPPEQRLHWQIEAMKLGFADTHAYAADPDLAPAPVSGLLDPAYIAARRALIGATAAVPAPGDPVRGGTVYLCAADAGGMMVSLIQSCYMGFGAHVGVPGYGFGLQNRGAGFSLEAGHPNVVAGGKRPFHTIIPAFLTRDGTAVGPFGVMGGHMQPQGHLQVVSSTVDDGLDPQAALDRPRWRWQSGLDVLMEGADPAIVDGLRSRGHRVAVSEDEGYGYGQIIWRLPGGAGYIAGSEARADGCAMAY